MEAIENRCRLCSVDLNQDEYSSIFDTAGLQDQIRKYLQITVNYWNGAKFSIVQGLFSFNCVGGQGGKTRENGKSTQNTNKLFISINNYSTVLIQMSLNSIGLLGKILTPSTSFLIFHTRFISQDIFPAFSGFIGIMFALFVYQYQSMAFPKTN